MSPDPDCRGPGDRWIVDLTLILGVLILANLVVATGAARSVAVGVQLVAATGAVIGSRWRGYTWSQLGLAIGDARPGLRLGGLVSLSIIAVVTAIALFPAVRPFFEDDRFDDLGAVDVAIEAAIRIPLVTALTEEILFRSVLLAVLLARWPRQLAVVATSIAFALWHLATAGDGFSGLSITLLVTGSAGVGFAWLRLRSGSIVASWMAHAAVNSSAYVVGALIQKGTL